MTTSPLPTPTLQPLPVSGELGLLPIVDAGDSCCGGGSCSIDG